MMEDLYEFVIELTARCADAPYLMKAGHSALLLLRPGTPLNSPCKLASSVLSWSWTLPNLSPTQKTYLSSFTNGDKASVCGRCSSESRHCRRRITSSS